MTIETIKNLLDGFVRSGGKIDELSTNDELFKKIKNAVIIENDHRLTLDEKFALAGYPREPKLTPIQRLKKLLDDYAKTGKDPSTIKRDEPIYQQIQNIYIIIDGRRMTMEEKWEIAGYKKKLRKAKNISELRALYDAFIKNGGDPKKIRTEAPELYQSIRNMSKGSNLEEKFAILGIYRKSAKTSDVELDFKNAVYSYLAAGGDLYISPANYPFYEKMRTVLRKYKRKGVELTYAQLFEKIGINAYSETYTNFKELFKLNSYRDSDGYVDSFRSDQIMNTTIDDYSEKLGIPQSLIVLLVANENLKKCYINTDIIDVVKLQIDSYLAKYNSFEHISTNDPSLYNKLVRLRKSIPDGSGKPMSTREFIEFLGYEDTHGTFKSYTNLRTLNLNELFAYLQKIGAQRNGDIFRTDIPNGEYKLLVEYVARNKTTIKDVLAAANLNYRDYRNYKLFNCIYVSEYPFIAEMRADRDAIMAIVDANNPGLCDAKRFEEYIKICKEVYAKYKSKIENFYLSSKVEQKPLEQPV
jgi:hypothetical protein